MIYYLTIYAVLLVAGYCFIQTVFPQGRLGRKSWASIGLLLCLVGYLMITRDPDYNVSFKSSQIEDTEWMVDAVPVIG